MAQRLTADTQHHGPMPADQGGESRFILAERKRFQQVSVRLFSRDVCGDKPPNMAKDRAELCVGHDLDPLRTAFCIYSPRPKPNLRFFLRLPWSNEPARFAAKQKPRR